MTRLKYEDVCRAEGVSFSFNGGKDSTVLLHVLRAAVAMRNKRALAEAEVTEQPSSQRSAPPEVSAVSSLSALQYGTVAVSHGTAAAAGGKGIAANGDSMPLDVPQQQHEEGAI